MISFLGSFFVQKSLIIIALGAEGLSNKLRPGSYNKVWTSHW